MREDVFVLGLSFPRWRLGSFRRDSSTMRGSDWPTPVSTMNASAIPLFGFDDVRDGDDEQHDDDRTATAMELRFGNREGETGEHLCWLDKFLFSSWHAVRKTNRPRQTPSTWSGPTYSDVSTATAH
jgi:hypothetical protein